LKKVFDFKNWISLNESENGKIPDSELVKIPVLKGKNYGHKLNPEAAKAYSEMVNAAKADGVVWGITDSYRPYKVQDRIFDWDLFKRTGKKRKKGTNGKVTVAYPGTSNHGWGSAVDLIVDKGDEAHDWLTRNSSRFGFSPLAGEPWHWEHKGSAKKIKSGAKLDSESPNYQSQGDSEYKYDKNQGLEDPGDGSKIYHEEGADPYYYQIRNGIWWTIGPRIPEWTSLEQNKEANEILDVRYPEARTTKEKMLNAMHYKKESIPTKFEPSKMRAGIIGTAASKISGWKEKIFTPSTGEHSTITIPNNQKKGLVPVIVLYPGIKVGNQIGKEYMPPLIRQAVPDWYDKYVIVIPDEHSTRWSDVKKDITEALSRSGLSQKSLTLGLFSGSGGRGTDVSRNLQSISPNNLLLMDPSPGKNLIDAIAYLPKETQVIMEYNPKNWGSPKWYTDYIGELVDEVQKRGLAYDTQSPNKDHMNIPSDMLIRYKQNIESNL
jgi:hypothetical protein